MNNWNEWEKLFKEKFESLPINNEIAYELKLLPDSLQWYIDNELKKHKPELYDHFDDTQKPGISVISLYRYKGDTTPSFEVINLFCYYLTDKSFQECYDDPNSAIYELLRQDKIFEQVLALKNFNKSRSSNKKRENRTVLSADIVSLTWDEIVQEGFNMRKELEPYGRFELNWDQIRERLSVNKNIFRALEVQLPDRKRIEGFFIIYPIKESTFGLLYNDDLAYKDDDENVNARLFSTNDICSDFNSADAKAIYVSTVYSVARFTEVPDLIPYLTIEVQRILFEHKNLVGVFTFPRTKVGKKWARFFRLAKLKNSVIWFGSSERILNRPDLAERPR